MRPLSHDAFQPRKNLRLRGFDYAGTGAYFVTVCAEGRRCLFGSCRDGVIHLSEIGRIVEEEWLRSNEIRQELALDQFVIMPNHLHAIVWINGESRAGRTSSQARTLGAFMAGFKSACTKQYRVIAGPAAKLWQKRFYDHVVRSEQELLKIREYIVNNPLRWNDDPENSTENRRPRLGDEPWL